MNDLNQSSLLIFRIWLLKHRILMTWKGGLPMVDPNNPRGSTGLPRPKQWRLGTFGTKPWGIGKHLSQRRIELQHFVWNCDLPTDQHGNPWVYRPQDSCGLPRKRVPHVCSRRIEWCSKGTAHHFGAFGNSSFVNKTNRLPKGGLKSFLLVNPPFGQDLQCLVWTLQPTTCGCSKELAASASLDDLQLSIYININDMQFSCYRCDIGFLLAGSCLFQEVWAACVLGQLLGLLNRRRSLEITKANDERNIGEARSSWSFWDVFVLFERLRNTATHGIFHVISKPFPSHFQAISNRNIIVPSDFFSFSCFFLGWRMLAKGRFTPTKSFPSLTNHFPCFCCNTLNFRVTEMMVILQRSYNIF